MPSLHGADMSAGFCLQFRSVVHRARGSSSQPRVAAVARSWKSSILPRVKCYTPFWNFSNPEAMDWFVEEIGGELTREADINMVFCELCY